MLKTIYKLWFKKPSRNRGVPAYIYASDESVARTELAERVPSADILDQVLTIDPATIGIGTLTATGTRTISTGGQSTVTKRVLSQDDSRIQDVLSPTDWAELQADLG